MVFRRLKAENRRKHLGGFRHGAGGMALGIGVEYQKWKWRAAMAVLPAFLRYNLRLKKERCSMRTVFVPTLESGAGRTFIIANSSIK